MAESTRCVLKVYSTPTFSLSTPRHYLAGVVGDIISFDVTASAIGAFTGDATVVLTGPDPAYISYNPPSGVISPGESVTISIDTSGWSESVTNLTITGTTA